MDTFDPYFKWLGIPPAEQPPDHYRLLGLQPFESDAEVIANAADQRMSFIRTFQAGPHSDVSQELLNRLAKVRVCLLNAERKAEYDEQLRAQSPAEPIAPSVSAASDAATQQAAHSEQAAWAEPMPPAFTPSANFAPVSAEPPVAPLYVPPVGIPVLPVSIPVPEPPLQPEARSPGPADMRVAVRPAYAARRHSTSPLAVVLMVAVGVSALALTAVALVYRDQPLRPASDKGASAGAAADPGAMPPSPSRGQQ